MFLRSSIKKDKNSMASRTWSIIKHCTHCSENPITFLGIAGPQSQFPHSCVCERFLDSQDRSTYFLQQNRQIECGSTVYKSLTDTCMRKLGLRPRNSFSWNICFRYWFFAVQCTHILPKKIFNHKKLKEKILEDDEF
jgi:hypothetical protein